VSADAELLAEPASYRMALSAGWVQLPMEPAAMRTAARRWLLQRFKDVSRDETVRGRRLVEDELVALTRRPGAEYARSLFVLALDVDRRPVSASCLVSVVRHDLSDEARLEVLAEQESVGALESTVTDLGRNRGVVVVRDTRVEAPEAGDPEQVADAAIRVAQEMGVVGEPTERDRELARERSATTRSVDVWIPVPDEPRTLLLQFSTPLRPLFDALTELFVVTACTVQWRRPDGTWG
jgi:hypothetical protein